MKMIDKNGQVYEGKKRKHLHIRSNRKNLIKCS